MNQQSGPQRVDCWQRQHPVTWKTLIELKGLYDIELKTLSLAKEIETAKISPLLF